MASHRRNHCGIVIHAHHGIERMAFGERANLLHRSVWMSHVNGHEPCRLRVHECAVLFGTDGKIHVESARRFDEGFGPIGGGGK